MLPRTAVTTLRRSGSAWTALRAAPSVLSGTGLAAVAERAYLPASHATLINEAGLTPRHDLTRGFAAPAKDEKGAAKPQGEAAAGGSVSAGTPADATEESPRTPEREMHAAEQQQQQSAPQKSTYWLFQPVYKPEYVEGIRPKHQPPETAREKLAYWAINITRWTFDKATGYGPHMDETKWLRRIVFLETVAGVPGMTGAMLRHFNSLRRMQRDHGWIHTLLEEAENERMHLLTFLQLRQPGYFFRGMVLLAQGVFTNAFFIAYLINPRYCHSAVGYLEEEAVKTYTHCIDDLDAGKLPQWEHKAAPDVAIKYWSLPEGAKMRDLLLAVRADEAGHSHVNHTLAKLRPDESNPFAPGSHAVP